MDWLNLSTLVAVKEFYKRIAEKNDKFGHFDHNPFTQTRAIITWL